MNGTGEWGISRWIFILWLSFFQYSCSDMWLSKVTVVTEQRRLCSLIVVLLCGLVCSKSFPVGKDVRLACVMTSYTWRGFRDCIPRKCCILWEISHRINHIAANFHLKLQNPVICFWTLARIFEPKWTWVIREIKKKNIWYGLGLYSDWGMG